jgi:RHS repeat-associated protein
MVAQTTNTLDTTRSVAYIFDPLNRIAQAYTVNTTSANCWGETYSPTATAPGVVPSTPGIDAWGNLTNITGVQTMTGCNAENLSVSVGTNNQITGDCYDGAGNLLDMGTCAPEAHSFVYDAEGQLQSPPVTGVGSSGIPYTYYYDGDGKRVQKCDANSNSCTSTTPGMLYWRGANGEVFDESSRTGTMQEEYVYFNGERIARQDLATNDVHYYFSDHLGSASVITDSSGNVEEQTDYFPYGGIAYSSGADENRYKFTGKERDTESGLDNFGARYYASTTGRFMTPDWAARPTAVPYAVFGDPQTLNLYSYVENAPVNRADADGHCCEGYEYRVAPTGGDLRSPDATYDLGTGIQAQQQQQQQKQAQQQQAQNNQTNHEPVLIAQNQTPNPQPDQQNKPQPNIPQEIKDIHSAYDKKVAEMTKNGERIGNGPVNNFVSSLQRIGEALGLTHHHLCSCNEQAEKISNSLNVSMKDTSYSFGLKQSWTHSWVEGRSSVQGAPVLTLDPWKNKFEVQQ